MKGIFYITELFLVMPSTKIAQMVLLHKKEDARALDKKRLLILFVCFVALRPKSTSMVYGWKISSPSAPFPGQA